MPTPEVIALVDQVQAHLDRGDLAAVRPVGFGPRWGGVFADAERAAKIVLADVDHCTWDERNGRRRVPAAEWAELADMLRRVLRAIAPVGGDDARSRGRGDGG